MKKYEPGVTLITCTGDRPEAFELCARFVAMQTWNGPLEWVIVNDGFSGPDGYVPWMISAGGVKGEAVQRIDKLWRFDDGRGLYRYSVDIARPTPKWLPGQNTLARNLLAAIPLVNREIILFAEDDDALGPEFVQRMVALAEENPSCQIFGDRRCIYYHVPSKRWRRMDGETHCSLAQTGIRARALPTLQALCERRANMIDVDLWHALRGSCVLAYGDIGQHVGIKGLPGRPGIGVGHQPDRNPELWHDDSDLSKLRSMIGDADVELYRRFMR